MHVGHIKAYSGLEVVSRKRRMQGYNVLFPIGFDAYGLPTENTAIKTGVHPRKVTDDNIKKFTGQLKKVGFSFDWSRVIDTTDENYYKWTQWIFLKMFENGLVFRDKTLVNYCPSCKVVLSNEDSQGGHCDVCHSEIVQKTKEVWYLRITEYADKLLQGLEEVDYLPNIKLQQQNWIGKSTGAFVNFKIKEQDEQLKIYTTRPDTLYGVTFMVIAPEHPIIQKYRNSIANIADLDAYKTECAKKSEFERTQLVKDKTGVKIDGLTAINPITGKEIPIYISDYVMMGYGTGAIMAVPAHDTRDYDFAKKFGIDIIEVIKGGDISKEAYTGDGEMVNSGELNGITNKKEAIEKMLTVLEKLGCGEKGVQYKMKDWAFNRQRYWGEPIPIVHCDKCGYGAPNLKTHAADKYKKPTKPERFRTEEEKELYAEWEKEKKEDTEIKRHYDPNAGKKTLAIVAVVVIGVIVAVLYKSGVIFSSTKTEVIEKYFKSIQTSDFDSFVECFPKEMKKEYEQQRTEGGYGKEQVMKEVLYGDFIESYGSDYTIDVSFGRETKLKESEYDLSEYKSFYGSAPNVSEAYEIVTNVTFKGSKGSEDAKLYIYVGKCSGKWCIFNITQDNGIVDEDTGLKTSEN